MILTIIYSIILSIDDSRSHYKAFGIYGFLRRRVSGDGPHGLDSLRVLLSSEFLIESEVQAASA